MVKGSLRNVVGHSGVILEGNGQSGLESLFNHLFISQKSCDWPFRFKSASEWPTTFHTIPLTTFPDINRISGWPLKEKRVVRNTHEKVLSYRLQPNGLAEPKHLAENSAGQSIWLSQSIWLTVLSAKAFG